MLLLTSVSYYFLASGNQAFLFGLSQWHRDGLVYINRVILNIFTMKTSNVASVVHKMLITQSTSL